MYKLFIKDTDITSGAVPISWCLPVETLDLFYSYNWNDPYIVIEVTPNKPDVTGKRFIAPLKDLMMYISFYTKGDNKICSIIVKDKKAAKGYLSRDRYCFDYRILDTYTQDYVLSYYDKELISEIITVNVPEDCFAKEPPQWEKNWVNFWFKYPAEDQCEFRRRRILAYTIQPIAMFVFYVMLFMFATILYSAINIFNILILNRYILKTLNPFYFFGDDSGNELYPLITHSIVYPKEGFNTYKDYLKFCLMPGILIPILTLVYLIFKFAAVAVSLIVVFSFFAFNIGYLMFYLCEYLFNKKEESKSEYWYLNKEYAKLVVCDGESKPTKISELPKNQTIKLRYQQLKSKVCKPFSR